MSSDVSVTFDSNADKLTQSMTDLSAGITALGASFKQAAEKTKPLNDGLSDLDRAAQAQKQAWAVMAQGINSSLDLVKKGIAGVKSAFDYLREGADISEAQQNFRAYTASIGKDADDLMKKMRQASKNQVSDMELMESATKALRLGVTKDAGTIGKLLEIADAKGDLFGKSLKETFDTIVDAIDKGQGKALIELGVLPESFGRASNAADLLKKRVLLLKEVLKNGQTDIAALAPVGNTASDSFNQLEAALKNLNDSFKSDLSQSLVSLVDFAKTTGIPAMKSTLDLFNDTIKALSKINETTGFVNGSLSIMAGALAGFGAAKVIGGLISVYEALKSIETAQLAINAAMLKNPLIMGGVVVGATVGAVVYDAKLLYDEWQANEQAAAMDKELGEQNNPASIARAEIMKLEAELKTYGDISQLTARRADLLQKINSHKQTIKDPLAAGIMSGYGLAAQTNDLGKAEDELKKIEAETAKIEAAGKKLADAKDTLKVILEQRKAIFDNKRHKDVTPVTPEDDTTDDKNNKKLTKELEERKKLFEALPPYIEESQKELAKFLDEMERLADKDTQIKSVVDALTNLSELDLGSTLNQFGNDLDNLIAGTNQTLIAMNFMSGGLLGAQGSSPVTREGAAAQMMSLMSGGLLGYSGTNNLEQKLKESFAKVKDEAKELENPLADTISSAVSDGFRRADFSGFLSSLGNGLSGVVGGILTDTVQSIFSKKNTGALAGGNNILGGLFKPVYNKDDKLNIGALGQNLAVGAAFSFLTSPGRLFGGRVVHGQENINASSSLNDQVTQAKDLRDRLYIQMGITDATRQMLEEAEFYYSWARKTKSGNGITSKKTTTYLLEGADQAQSSIDKIKYLQETALGEQANRNYSIFQAGRYSNTDALAMTAADAESAYQASLATNENSPEIQAMRGQQDYYRTMISNMQTSAAQQARQTKGKYNYYQSNMLIGNYQQLIGNYQQQIAALQDKIDATSGYKYSAAERAEMLQQRDQAQINLTTAKESGRTNLMQTFMGNNTMLQQASSGDITDMLLGNRQLGNNADMISTLVPMIESAKFKDYEMTRAFADAGNDPEKLLAAYQAQQTVDTNALAVARRLYEDAKEESLNTNLSPEEYTAAFERFQTSLDKVTELQAKVADNTSVIADLQKQSALDKLTTELSDIMSVVVEKINQKSGVEIHTYRQAYTKGEFVAKLKETLAAKDPELAAEFAKYSQYIEELGDWE